MAFAAIPAAIILFFLVRKNFIQFMSRSEQEAYNREKRGQRTVFIVIRSLLLLMVLLAIASPFLLETKTVKGNPRITILIDNSTSMNLFESGIGQQLVNDLKGTVPVTVRTIAVGQGSALGDGILTNLERDENVLVVTDGNSNEGTLLGDIMLLASSLNATISTLQMDPIQQDVRVWIDGPSEAIRDTTETFTVRVTTVGAPFDYTLEVRFDNEIVLAKTNSGTQQFLFNKKMTEGYHSITATLSRVGSADYFKQNNKAHKSVKVVPRPEILFVSEKSSPLSSELGKIYDLATQTTIPQDIGDYLAVITNDLPASSLVPKTSTLSEYVSGGNGLFVIGGQSSYDRGGYKGTLLETLLPVKMGAGEESEKSDVYVVIVIDVSGTTGRVFNSRTGQYEVRGYDDIIKAQAVSVIDSLADKTNVGVVVIGVQPVGTIVELAELDVLDDNKDDIIDQISRISRDKVGGQTEIRLGITKATKMLREASGGKNIILISDGKGLGPLPQQEVIDTVRNSAGFGIKTYVAGVGATDDQANDFLGSIAAAGNAIYFPIDAKGRLKVLFGDPEESQTEKDYYNKLIMLDTTHFITYNQSLDVVVNGYNYIIPKSASRLLISTNKNIPIMAVWRFGLGRVVSLATDDGGAWAAELLQQDNSKVVTKAINWAIGDLSRKKAFDVKTADTTLGEMMTVQVISNSPPQHEQLQFVKTDVNTYSASYEPQETGFVNFLGAQAAVNYHEEFADLGVNTEFTNLIEQTGGQIFDKGDTETILKFIREKSKRIKVDSIELKWPFIIAALILFIIEIAIRRVWENRGYR